MHHDPAISDKAFWLSSGAALLVDGPAGRIEVLTDLPKAGFAGVVLIAHPQPLLGGSAAHKIPQLLARAARDAGWLALRPNFRGVGRTEGRHDHGQGELEDMALIASGLQAAFAPLPLYLAGFSFGAFVQACTACRLSAEGRAPDGLMLLGLPCGRVESGRSYDTPGMPPNLLPSTHVFHGERDAQTSLASVLDWARPQALPVTVLPGADHFFTGQLVRVRDAFVAQLALVASA